MVGPHEGRGVALDTVPYPFANVASITFRVPGNGYFGVFDKYFPDHQQVFGGGRVASRPRSSLGSALETSTQSERVRRASALNNDIRGDLWLFPH